MQVMTSDGKTSALYPVTKQQLDAALDAVGTNKLLSFPAVTGDTHYFLGSAIVAVTVVNEEPNSRNPYPIVR